jgi:hypothetical protein
MPPKKLPMPSTTADNAVPKLEPAPNASSTISPARSIGITSAFSTARTAYRVS